MIFVHAVLRTEWESAILNGIYKGPTLETEGFIHCSPIHKMVRWEDLYNEGSEYPHIYGELNFDAVVKTVEFEPNVDGDFSLPQELAELKQ